MYRWDTHVHTSEVSQCGNIKAQDGVRLYKEAGYSGIVITDHYYSGFFQKLPDMTWEEKIEQYLQGYKKALAEGINLGLTVLLGIEIRFTENPNDYLVFGMTEEFLLANPEGYTLGLKDFKKLIDEEDMLLFQAHPFRSGMVVADPKELDGVEIYNGNARHNSHNDKALAFARENGLLMSSGSDFHETEDLSRGGIIFTQEIRTNHDFLQALKGSEKKEFVAAK
ncbi:MAG: transposase [Herbinix sp.]|jgi:predicted metal-dependent phosphoesterase TrpH|nr:transposase [Herbinix sp.]